MKRISMTLLLALLVFNIGGYGQRKFDGKVIEVIDGKTVVIEINSGRLKAMLQYIEIPESKQPLHNVVRDHLSKLVLGKLIEFHAMGILSDKTVGRLYLGGIDISQQMVRDGAAWHEPLTATGQDSADAREYTANQMLAKAEKRGVWADSNLKPSWEMRAVQDKTQKKNAVDDWNVYLGQKASEPVSNTPRAKRSTAQDRIQANAGVELWPEIGVTTKTSSSGFLASYDQNRKEGYTATPGGAVSLSGQRTNHKLEFRALFVYRGEPSAIEQSAFIIGFLSQSDDYIFPGLNNLTIVADKQNISIGEARRLFRPIPSGVQELLLYKIGKESLTKFANAKKISVRLAKYSGTIDNEIQPAVRQLIELSN